MTGRLYAFLDLETTGLDPESDSVIEIAWTFTDERFEVVGPERSMLVEPRGWDTFWAALRNEPRVREMHTASGLLDDLTHGTPEELDAVYERLRADVIALPAHDALHLAGFSVHFDRQFLMANGFRRMLSDRFHHRHLDLSATKLLLGSLSLAFDSPVNGRPHRAASDVRESIEQARLFAEQLTVKPSAGIPAGRAIVDGKVVALA